MSAIFSIRCIGLSMICLSFVKQLNLLRRRYGANYNRIGKIKYINCLPCLRPVTWTLNKLLKIVFLTFWQVKWNIAVNWPIITEYGYWLCFILLLRIFISLLSLLLVGFWCCSYIQMATSSGLLELYLFFSQKSRHLLFQCLCILTSKITTTLWQCISRSRLARK